MNLHNNNNTNELRDYINPFLLLHKLPVHHHRKTIFLEIDNIVYFESDENDCLIYINGQEDPIPSNYTLDFLESLLGGLGFFRIKSCYLIDLRYLTDFETDGKVHLRFNKVVRSLTVSHEQLKRLKRISHLDQGSYKL